MNFKEEVLNAECLLEALYPELFPQTARCTDAHTHYDEAVAKSARCGALAHDLKENLARVRRHEIEPTADASELAHRLFLELVSDRTLWKEAVELGEACERWGAEQVGVGTTEKELDPERRGWRELSEFPGTGYVKVLRDKPESGARTLLLRVPPGEQVAPGPHPRDLQYFVVEGDCQSGGVTYRRGSHGLVPANVDPGPVTTDNGVTFLMIFDPV